MATSQTTLGTVGVHEFEIGDLIETRSGKNHLLECPLCAADPMRQRHHFGRQDNPPQHIRDVHGGDNE